MKFNNNLSHTDRFLLKWSSSFFNPTLHYPEFLEHKDKIDWNTFSEKAQLSHLSGFAYWFFLNNKLSGFNASLWKSLQIKYVQILQSNTHFLTLHQEMCTMLEDHQIPFSVLKGMDLIFRTYRELGVRHISDIDLLILPEHLEKVKLLFEEKGFSCSQSVDKSHFHEKHFQLHAPLQASKNGMNIDVHIMLYDTLLGFHFPTEQLISRREKISWQEQETWVLQKSDSALFNILHLYVHLDKGNHFKMSSFLDVLLTLSALDYPKNKHHFEVNVQTKIEHVIDCMIWMGLLNEDYLPRRKKAPKRYYFYIQFFLKEQKPTLSQLIRFKFLPRFVPSSFSWKIFPLIFFEAFPSKKYLNKGNPNSHYAIAWIKRLRYFARSND